MTSVEVCEEWLSKIISTGCSTVGFACNSKCFMNSRKFSAVIQPVAFGCPVAALPGGAVANHWDWGWHEKKKERRYRSPKCIDCTAQRYEITSFVRNGCPLSCWRWSVRSSIVSWSRSLILASYSDVSCWNVVMEFFWTSSSRLILLYTYSQSTIARQSNHSASSLYLFYVSRSSA